MLLKNKTALITGCNRGIGRAIVEAFAKEGCSIWAHARKESEAFVKEMKELEECYAIKVQPIYFDLTNGDEIKRGIKSIRASKMPIDILVNNAGITYNALFQMSSEEKLREQFEVNFFSVFLLTQYISKLMVRQKQGRIINIASSAALDGNPGKSVYGASKAAVIAMTKSIAEELGETGIRANCIAPGITETEMLLTMPKEIVEATKKITDLGRAGQPFEIAEAVVFLASDLSGYITGQVLRVDGGLG